jgi:hypothetical protein
MAQGHAPRTHRAIKVAAARRVSVALAPTFVATMSASQIVMLWRSVEVGRYLTAGFRVAILLILSRIRSGGQRALSPQRLLL